MEHAGTQFTTLWTLSKETTTIRQGLPTSHPTKSIFFAAALPFLDNLDTWPELWKEKVQQARMILDIQAVDDKRLVLRGAFVADRDGATID